MVSTKRERLEARVTREQKELFQRAADIEGRSLSDFLVKSLTEAAEKAIRDRHVMHLTAQETEQFFDALLNPPEPNERLREAARLYRELVEQR
jgi:uncharacterized protein (DUF1778 family)